MKTYKVEVKDADTGKVLATALAIGGDQALDTLQAQVESDLASGALGTFPGVKKFEVTIYGKAAEQTAANPVTGTQRRAAA